MFYLDKGLHIVSFKEWKLKYNTFLTPTPTQVSGTYAPLKPNSIIHI